MHYELLLQHNKYYLILLLTHNFFFYNGAELAMNFPYAPNAHTNRVG